MNAIDITARGLAQRAIDTQRLPNRAALEQALANASNGASLLLAERGREGRFAVWSAAAFFNEFGFTVADARQADPQQGIFVAAADDTKIARRAIGNGAWEASWFGWTRNDRGGTGAGNRDALRAIESLIAYTPPSNYRPFSNGIMATQVVDLGWGEYDLGAPGDSYGFRRVWGHYRGQGPMPTQIVWKGDADATVIQWDATQRGFFKDCWFGGVGTTNAPNCWIDTTYDSGLGLQRAMDWGDCFDNFFGDVSSSPDAAAIKLNSVVNFTFNYARFEGGTRHIYVLQPAGASAKRGLRVLNYTFDFSNSAPGVFKEHICVDLTGTASLDVYLAPTRCEGAAQPATNAAIVRVTDSVGPNTIGLFAVSLTIASGAGWQWSHASSAAWVVYHDTTQTTCFTPVHIPHGLWLNGFQGIAGGNWNTFYTRWEPAFTTITELAPYSNDPRNDNNLGYSARVAGRFAFGQAAAVITTKAGSPEGSIIAPPGSQCLSPTSTPGFINYRKVTGTGNTGWRNDSSTKGAIGATTDASGDITVAHSFGGTPGKIDAKIDGPTLRHTAIHMVGNSTFKVRVFDSTGAALASTAVTGWWEAETTS